MNRREHLAAAEKGKRNSRARSDDHVTALYNVVTSEMSAGRVLEAQIRCRTALERSPDNPELLHLMALVCSNAKQFGHAVEWASCAIRKNPKPAYLTTLGTALLNLRRYDDALKVFDKAVQLKPDDADLWRNLGNALTVLDRSADAILSFQQALKLDPGHRDAARNCGLLLHRLGRLEKALSQFRSLAALQGDDAMSLHMHDTYNSLGAVLVDLSRFDEALTYFIKALEIKADSIVALNDAGTVLVNLKRPEDALSMFDRALCVSPELAELFSNKANAMKALGHYDDALACYDRAIALKPDYAQAHCNRGVCLDEMRRADEALSSYRRALDLQPGYAEAHWNIAVNRLRAGDLKSGWLESEWRWKCPALRLVERAFRQPLWLGSEPLDGKILLLHSDQGLGDALQFCRYVPLAAARGARVILEVEQSLSELVSHLNGVSQVVCKGDAIPDFDLHCPLGSLPLAFDTTLNNIPSDVPYLSASDRTNRWSGRLGSVKIPRIGLVWSGNPKHGNDSNRSIALRTLLPLLNTEAQFVSLQKDVRPDDQSVLREQANILNLGPELNSFADTAALLAHLDLVISVDTSVAHLAGALGRPVWILLPYMPDWRWLLDRDDSPWYPSVRLFRQTETREYWSVVDRMRTELSASLAAGSFESTR